MAMLQQEVMTTIDFQESELTEQVGTTARDFAEQYIRPYVMEWDETQEFPISLFKEMGKLGLMGVLIPEAYGGFLATDLLVCEGIGLPHPG